MLQVNEDSTVISLQKYFRTREWLNDLEKINSIEKAGDGNMNVVLRITTDQRSIIVKQSRPFVQKYQNIAAPIERIAIEHTFYNAISNSSINKHIPMIIGYDEESFILVMEDLGDCDDMSFLYEQRTVEDHHFDTLIKISHQIHCSVPPADFPDNLKMRVLNHQHIFILPFQSDNGFSLDDVQPGLQKIARSFKADEPLKKEVTRIGEKYLSTGDTLIHGDYYPGSWMSKHNQIFIIDPEFGFIGFVEFDLGVMAAHLLMATHDLSCVEKIESAYPKKIDSKLLEKITGIEMMRRLLGLAQIPLKRTIEEKEELLTMAKNLILS